LLEILLYSLSGFFMKISDDMHDKKNNKFFGMLTGILCGVFMGYLVTFSLDAIYIFFGVFTGTFLAKKINCINHAVTAVIFLLIVFLKGLPLIGIGTLAVCTIAAYIDEIGNDNKRIYRKGRILEIFFKYRFALKTVILVLALFGIISSFYPGFQVYGIHFMTIQSLVLFLIFELAYEFAALKFDSIYGRIYSILKLKDSKS